MDEINLLERAGLKGFDLIDINLSDKNDFQYTLKYKDIINTITVQELNNVAVNYHIVEGDKINDVIITNDNKVIIDGAEVIYENDTTALTNSIIDVGNDISPRAGFTFYETQNCPYGSASDYTYLAKTKNNARIVFENAIQDYATSAAVAALTGQIQSFVEYAVYDIIADAVIKIAAYAVAHELDANIISYKGNIWYHNSTCSFSINNTLKVKEFELKSYIGTNYQYYIGTDTCFICGIWG